MNESFSQSGPTANHIYTIELRFSGDTLEPSEITRRLNLQPANSSDGTNSSSDKRKVRPFWAYNGHDQVGFQPEWLSLEQGLDFLLRQLASHRATVVELSQKFDGLWWCGHFQSSFDGGPLLSSKVLAEVASYGLPFAIDNYFSSEPS